MVPRGVVDTDAITSRLGEKGKQAPQLLLESLVEVEINERVVDVGAFGEERREHEALRSHVPVPFVENEEEGHDGIRRPGNHEAQADAEKHLEEESDKLDTHTLSHGGNRFPGDGSVAFQQTENHRP